MDDLLDGVHVCSPGTDRGVTETSLAFADGDGFIGDGIPPDAVDEVQLDVGDGRLEYYAISAVCSSGETYDEDFLKLFMTSGTVRV